MAMVNIDTEMDQEKYLREVTHHFRGIEKPLEHGPSIGSLKDLIKALHKEFSTNYVNIEMVNHIMLAYKSNPTDWQEFEKFDRCQYTRNLVDAGNDKFNLMILCWGEGHGSSIHDHSDSHCFMKMLRGELMETRYASPKAEAPLKQIGQKSMHVNDVVYINDNLGLHRVENPSQTDTSVSLHLYCPPFDHCSKYDEATSKSEKCNVTFWSKYGKEIEQQQRQPN